MAQKIDEYITLWTRVLEKINASLDKKIYDAFFKDTYIHSIEGKMIYVSCPSEMSASYISMKYANQITEIVNEITESDYKLEFKKESDFLTFFKDEEANKKPKFFANIYLKPELNFDNFVVGPTNSEAQAASLIVANSPGQLYNPLFLYSQSGLGKTHLLNAIGNYINEKEPIKKVLYCTSQNFIDEYINYVRSEKTEDNLKQYINSFDVLLVDDIQLLQNKTKTEEFFFSIFETLTRFNKQIVLTCDRLPDELDGLDQRLVTRFMKGLTISIKPPTKELCEQILTKKIENSQLSLDFFDKDVLSFVADEFKTSIRNLEGALNRLIFYSSINNLNHINMDVANDALASLIDTKKTKSKLSAQKILNCVASFYNLSVSQITSTLRLSQIAIARHIAIYLMRTMLNLSYTQIAEIFNRKDHTTIMHSCKKIEDMLKSDPDFPQVIHRIKKKLNSKGS